MGDGGRDRSEPHPSLVTFTTGRLALHAIDDAEPGPAHAVIRAEEITVAREPHPTSARNHFTGRVTEVVWTGALARVTVDVEGTPIVAALTAASARELELVAGAPVHLSFKATAVHLC